MQHPALTDTVLMIRPAHFGFNPQTALDNKYQQLDSRSAETIAALARAEFDAFVQQLEAVDIQVLQLADTPHPIKTDAVFPNNWFSTHADGRVILYPMFAPTRRLERRLDCIEYLIQAGFRVEEVIDLSFFEESGQFLEGTGSIVMDRAAHRIYACHSERTHEVPLRYLSELLGAPYTLFHSVQELEGKSYPIYHTNVMMHVGKHVAVVALDTLPNKSEQNQLLQLLQESGKVILPIKPKQVQAFAGNMLELISRSGDRYTVLSRTAYESLKPGQVRQLEKHSGLLIPEIPTIERLGGGSVRCMLAEIFLPRA
ncbi:MAG: citrulline utilization hydrolase CtlX [Nitritalea sp.]